MWRYLILSGSILISAVQAPALFEKIMAKNETSVEVKQTSSAKPEKIREKPTKIQPTSGRKVRLKSDSRGHFQATIRMNNRPVKALIDTGATMVAINESTARKLGIRLKASDFKYNVRTANGLTKMAAATIREIQIGGIRVKNVRAGVSRDSALSTTLLGMSFLGQLKRFEFRGDTLLLEQ